MRMEVNWGKPLKSFISQSKMELVKDLGERGGDYRYVVRTISTTGTKIHVVRNVDKYGYDANDTRIVGHEGMKAYKQTKHYSLFSVQARVDALEEFLTKEFGYNAPVIREEGKELQQ